MKIRRDHFTYRTFAKCVSEMNEAITSLPPSQNNQEYLVNQNQSLNLSETIFQVYHQAVSHSVEALEHIVFCLGLYAIVCLIVYLLIFRKWTAQWYRNATNVRFPQSKRTLVVIAHPDDESMFFGPTIISLVKRNCQVFLLCLSNGNHGKLGHQRQQELWRACKILNIPDENITIVNATLLPDDPTVAWKPQLIAKQILKQVHTLDIDTVITYDRDGVSHHANHSAIFYASISLYVTNLLQDGCRLFTLDSVNVCRKYTFLFDLLLSMTLSNTWCILNWTDFRRVQKAMHEHRTQMVWFRRLYIIFSRYMIINTLREIQISDAELEMQIASFQKTNSPTFDDPQHQTNETKSHTKKML